MRAILINPYACTVAEIRLAPVDYGKAALDLCRPFCLVGRDRLFYDRRTLENNPQRFFTISGYEQPVCGFGLIIGLDALQDWAPAQTPLDAITVRYYHLGMGHEALDRSSYYQSRCLFITTTPYM